MKELSNSFTQQVRKLLAKPPAKRGYWSDTEVTQGKIGNSDATKLVGVQEVGGICRLDTPLS